MTKIKQSEKSLSKISDNLSVIPDIPDPKTSLEETDYEREEKLLHLKEQSLLVEGIGQDINERKSYANRVFKLIVSWLLMIFLLLIAQGTLAEKGYFKLPEKLLLAIIGGTTINVIGLFAIVINYLFPKPKK